MNPDDLVKAFINAGLDAPEKVQAVLADLATNIAIKRIDIELDGLRAKQEEAMKPIQDARTELQSQRDFLTAKLSVK